MTVAGDANGKMLVHYAPIGGTEGLYLAVASRTVDVTTTYYATMQEAITAAGDNNLASITVLDATAELPDGYYIENNEIKQYQAAVVDTEGTAHYYATPTAAANDVDTYLGVGTQKTYSYFAVYFGTDVEMEVNLGAMAWNVFSVKVKCLNGATVSVVPNSAEYEFIAGEPEDNIVTYAKADKATSYFWGGATSAEAGTTAKNWNRPNNWKIGTASGAAASRAPSSIDTANIPEGAYVSGISVADSLTITGSGTITAANGISLTAAGATISVTGVTLSPEPTAADTTNYRVRKTTAAGTTTYTVVDKVGTIFSVY